jgi:predicted nucleic acid-binding protein
MTQEYEWLDLQCISFDSTWQKVPLLGTLGLLIRAKQRGLIDQLALQLPLLESAGANLSQSVIAHALKLAGE